MTVLIPILLVAVAAMAVTEWYLSRSRFAATVVALLGLMAVAAVIAIAVAVGAA